MTAFSSAEKGGKEKKGQFFARPRTPKFALSTSGTRRRKQKYKSAKNKTFPRKIFAKPMCAVAGQCRMDGSGLLGDKWVFSFPFLPFLLWGWGWVAER